MEGLASVRVLAFSDAVSCGHEARVQNSPALTRPGLRRAIMGHVARCWSGLRPEGRPLRSKVAVPCGDKMLAMATRAR
jgi:hypothetical protein